MTSAQASRVVFVAGGIEAAFVLARAKRGGISEETTVRSLIAIGILTFGLSFFADLVPEIAGPFAILILVAMAARSRGQIAEVLGFNVPAQAAASAQSRATRGRPKPTGIPERRSGR